MSRATRKVPVSTSSETPAPRMSLFCIRDSKAGYYAVPFTKGSIGEAERDFTLLARDSNSMVGKFPPDFDLYQLGSFCERTGKIIPFDTPQHLCKAVDLISQ